MPESSTPTTIDGSPVVTACAAGTSICAMSHCRPQRGSAVGSPVASTAAESTASMTSSSMSVVPSPCVEATDSTPLPATAPANAVFVDRTTSTPIWS